MDTIIQTQDLCKTYNSNSISNNVLRNVNIKINKGEFVTVMGPSGSGKSTLLYTVSGMELLTSGKVFFNYQNIHSMNDKQLSELRLKKMGFIFQQMYMLNKLNVFDNIVLPGYHLGIRTRKEINNYAEELMYKFGIIEIAESNINKISGGQLQRACICRALINKPDVIFADEPTGSLNSSVAENVINELTRINSEGTTILMVTHSVRVASRSQRVIYLSDGIIKGETLLKKQNDNNDFIKTEHILTNWLMNHGW